MWPVEFSDLIPYRATLCSKFGVAFRPLASVFVRDVAESDEDVYKCARHAKGFVAETIIEETDR